MEFKKIVIGSDHAGFELKEHLQKKLKDNGFEVEDCGTYSDERADYPDFAHKVATEIEKNAVATGILVCGSANGVAMAANKHNNIRCAICWNEEIAQLAKQHNNANIIALPSRFITLEEAELIVNSFLNASFEGGRHQQRIDKISCS